MEIVQVKRFHPQAVLPTRGTPDSAGLDLYACLERPILIRAKQKEKIHTGLGVALPKGTVGLIFGRSSLGVTYGLAPANAVGVIDADYRGELIVSLFNNSQMDYTVQPGDRIAQLVITPVYTPQIVEVTHLAPTERGAGGFGSTGR